MESFVVNKHGRVVLPCNFEPALDFSVLRDLDQLSDVIRRNFDSKAPTGTRILERIADKGYANRYDLLRDMALNLFWANRYAMSMYAAASDALARCSPLAPRPVPSGAGALGER